MDRTQQTYCSNCGRLGHYRSQCPQLISAEPDKGPDPGSKSQQRRMSAQKKGRSTRVKPEVPEEVEVPEVCPECGTNLKAKAKRAEYMRRYMRRKRGG